MSDGTCEAPDCDKQRKTRDKLCSMHRARWSRHKTFDFGEARADGGRIAQRVHIVDDNGEAWEAMYTLEQQSDGSLKITGCSLLKAGQAV